MKELTEKKVAHFSLLSNTFAPHRGIFRCMLAR
jgi:hypothetical protein